MQIARFLILVLAAGLVAKADFSYTNTRKSGAGAMSGAGDQVSKVYMKGQKMMTDSGSTATLMDFEAQTVTSINKTARTYSVRPFGQMGQMGQAAQEGPEVQVDFKQTGQHKVINGFDATQGLMSVQADMPQSKSGSGMKMQMEMEFWVSPDVPGAQEMHDFYARNMSRFPWASMGAGVNPSMQKAMAEIQKRMATMHGVPVLEIMRMKMGGGNDAQAAQMQQGMAQARARLEAMAQQGGPQGDAAKQALARMGGMSGGGGLSETTIEASGFSTDAIPDSVFAIPAGFQKTER
jgi:hypothetical protein